MKKIVDLLEQNIQWLVLALSIAWVIYIAWAYLLNPPVSVVLVPGGKALLPSEVDTEIYNEGAAVLDQKIHSSAPATAPAPPNYAAQFRDAMTYASEPAPVLASSRWILPSTPYIFVTEAPNPTSPAGPMDNTVRPPRQTENAAGLVAELPELPPARLGDNRTGMSFVQVTPNSTGADKAWVSIRFEIDSSAIAKAWDAKKIPERNYSNTTFLQVGLDRQELQPDGTWSQPVPIAPLANSQLLPMPQGTNAKENFEYAKWAAPRQRDILQPAFYTIVKGDQWLTPGVAGPNAAAGMEDFKPKDHIHDNRAALMNLTPEQRRLVQAEIAKEAEKHKPPPRVTPPPRRGPAAPAAAPGNAEQGPRDPGRPTVMDGGAISFQAQSETPEEDANGLPIPPKRTAPAAPAPGVPATPAAPPPAAAAPGAKPDEFPVPNTEFDPHKWAADHAANTSIIGWAHDDSVQAGHVYKYRITYKVKNPVFALPTIVKDSKLAETFALTSIPSDWSEQVEVASTLKFFIAGARPSTSTASFQVFRRQEGELKTKTFTVGPGDTIGTKDGDVDFTTDWMVVDVRTDRAGGEAYILLMDKSGTLVRRDANADASNPDYLHSKQQAAGAGGGAASLPHSEPISAAGSTSGNDRINNNRALSKPTRSVQLEHELAAK